MSAPILRPGDVIHLALPLDPQMPPELARERAQADGAEQAEFYARFGVTVAQTSSCPLLAYPVVVAVFRKEGEE